MRRYQAGHARLLGGALLVSAALLVPSAYLARQGWGAGSALAALATCSAGGFLALWLAQRFRGEGQMLTGMLWAMFARMGVPLSACVLVYLQDGKLAKAGFVYYLLAYYFVTLVVETVLLVGDAPPQFTKKPTV